MAKINVTTHYPYSEEFEWITEMVDINLDEERIRDVSSGNGFIIKSPKPIKDDVKDPEGIFSTRFGPTLNDDKPWQDRYRCQCGHLKMRIMNSETCPICKTKVKYVDDNFGFFGWIVLREQYWVIHPSLYFDLQKFIGKDVFENILKMDKPVDEDGNIINRQADNKKEKEPFYGIGMMEFHDRFDEIIRYYYQKAKTPSKVEFFDVIKNNREKIFTHSIPVYTTLLRPFRVEAGVA